MTYRPQALTAFVQEARELLVAMETVLLTMAFDGVSKAGIDAVFRAVHTVKGSASIFELDHVVDFAHLTESVLEQVRNTSLILDDDMRTLLLECNDYVSSQIDAIEQKKEEQPADLQRRDALKAKLSRYLDPVDNKHSRQKTQMQGQEKKVRRVKESKKMQLRFPVGDAGIFAHTPYWYLSLRFDRTVLAYGLNPVAFMAYLGELGQIIAMRVMDDNIPAASRMNPEYCYIGFDVVLQSEASRETLAAVFDVLSDEASIMIIAPYSDIGAYQEVWGHFKKPVTCLHLLQDMQVLDSAECRTLVNFVRERKYQQVVLEVNDIVAPDQKSVLPAALRDLSDNQFIKIEVGKLDQLIDLVGELVTAGVTANLVAKIKRDQRFQEATQAVSELVKKIRDTALTFRMVGIHEIFQRFPRVVRETARELGKEVDLVITGEETELDKAMMDKISNPLMHLVRNAIDHGIEPASERAACGKNKKGKIRLHARHESGSIVIEIADDGKGIDQHRVLEKAVEKGLVQRGAVLTKTEILNLIFVPGFSTADKVTAISGRGVGMDVVKKNIDQLHGKVTVDSVSGKGTTMRIRLPLTLAIISGFQVIVGDMVFVLPLDMVVECINLTNHPVNNNIVTLRGEPLSFISMRRLFDMPARDMSRRNMLVVQYAQYRIGIVVDELQGECQAVVKPLNTLFGKMKGLSGSAILGDGRIALILDVAHLVEYVKQSEKSALLAAEQRSR